MNKTTAPDSRLLITVLQSGMIISLVSWKKYKLQGIAAMMATIAKM
jgi:hypothetical protein